MSAATEELPLRHALTVPAVGAAVRMARETAEMVFTEWGVNPGHPTVNPALLVLSELVTNSVRHAAEVSPMVTVIFAGGRDCLAFGVHDRHPYRPSLSASLIGPDAGGLGTVMELTLGLGGTAVVHGDPDGQGKSIWITLPL
ncbi:ATP-binding protein [Streptomyces antnestii]|uniref:ATP-binding protein n=1 Tax=Streptomyces antnestii TaxID=2494256 RepID=A0A3S2Z3U9_9ACTN|nr:ATP-binding protein [Streptomyces sp. San01]RVU28014.1 ATP-binding protein [Streptomyces sp. San01]